MANNYKFQVLLPLLILLLYLADAQCGLNVILNITLNSKIVEPFQMVLFTCITRGSGIVNWFSDEYIGTDGLPIQLLAAGNTTTVSGNSDPNTVATRISVTTENGERVVVSELKIIVSPQHLIATVSCDDGDRNLHQSITFTLPNVTLVSTLSAELTAYSNEPLIFTCTTRGSGILNWQSAEYIERDGLPLQILSLNNRTTEHSNSDPNTVATRINVTNNNGVIVIVSELRIKASSMYPTATIACYIDAEFPKMITFKTTGRSNEVTSVTTTKMVTHEDMPPMSTTNFESTRDNSKLLAIAIGAALIVLGIIFLGIHAYCSGFCGNPNGRQPVQIDTELSSISEVSTSTLKIELDSPTQLRSQPLTYI